MNPDRDALEGLINKNDVGSAESLPSVSRHLLDYLKAQFPAVPFSPTGLRQLPRGVSLAEAALWDSAEEYGKKLILDHLEQLAQNKGVNANEPTETESASADPRRPGSSRRS